MFKKNNKSDKIDYQNVNDTVLLFNKILRLLFFVLIVCGIFITSYILKQWNIFPIFKTILKVLTPFFIGFIIAWLFNPIVKFLCRHKFNRVCATLVVYIGFLALFTIFVIYSVPTLTNQFNEFVNIIPKITNSLKDYTNSICEFFAPLLGGDVDNVKTGLLNSISDIAKNISTGLPDKVFGIMTSIISGFGTLLMGLFIGLYMLFDFDNVSRVLINFLPANWRDDARNLVDISNRTLVNYIQGIFLTTTLIWIENSIGFSIAGLKASILFALFSGITNVIPYVGPYIGGVPAVIVGFSQSITTGIIVLISLVVAQLLDNVIFTPLVQSKNLKLHPVTIIIALLVFGHFFGIVGMVVAVPLIATFKTIFHYFNKKYEIIKINEEINEEIEKEKK